MHKYARSLLTAVVSACLVVTVSSCDSDSSAQIVGAGSVGSDVEGDFFDSHFNDRPESLHYSAHDTDTNRRESGGFGELQIAAALPDTFRNWESPHVHPLHLTPDNNLLLAVNTADAKLEVFEINGSTPVSIDAIPVGLDPVSVRARSNTEAWVCLLYTSPSPRDS